MPGPDAACLGFVNLWDMIAKPTAWAKEGCLPGSATERGSGLCERWVGWDGVSGNPQDMVSLVVA